jgi:hypothetical protein
MERDRRDISEFTVYTGSIEEILKTWPPGGFNSSFLPAAEQEKGAKSSR